jgi:hypothetical protein
MWLDWDRADRWVVDVTVEVNDSQRDGLNHRGQGDVVLAAGNRLKLHIAQLFIHEFGIHHTLLFIFRWHHCLGGQHNDRSAGIALFPMEQVGVRRCDRHHENAQRQRAAE